MDQVIFESEINKYINLKKIFPQAVCWKYLDKTSDPNHFDILKTRYIYMELFNSMPPENFWYFKKMLCSKTQSYLDIDIIKNIQIIICKNDTDLKIKKLFLSVLPTDTWDFVKLQLVNLQLVNLYTSCNLIFSSSDGIINLNSQIGDITEICVFED